MPAVAQLLVDLRRALETNANEHQLLSVIDESLSSLRASYRTCRSEFSDEAVAFLKSLTPVQESLRQFIEAVEEIDEVRTRDDAQELAARFGELKERLTPHLAAKRAEKEFREMLAKASTLAFAAVATSERAFRHLCFQLESQVQGCQDCGNKMALRESQRGYFWGCSAFPTCFKRRWLSAKEFRFLFP